MAAAASSQLPSIFCTRMERRIRCAEMAPFNSAPKSEPADTYVYNPGNPAPTIGGPLCCDEEHMEPGPARPAGCRKSRRRAGLFDRPARQTTSRLLGRVTADLFIKSSAIGYRFYGEAGRRRPDGFAQDLTEGILRMRYRSSAGTCRLDESRTDL